LIRENVDLSGQKFGRLIVLKNTRTKINGRTFWHCQCECGKKIYVRQYSLRDGNTKSCGCWKVEAARNYMKKNRQKYQNGTCNPNYKHGDASGGYISRLRRIWGNMKIRCRDPKAINYRYYGGKNISVCPQWSKDYRAFKMWALANGYRNNLTIDRINNDGNYEPSNCQWISNCENSAKSQRDRKLAKWQSQKAGIQEIPLVKLSEED